MLTQVTGGTAFYLICATFGLVILGMAANQWFRLGTADYLRLAVAAGVLLLGRMVGLLALLNDWNSSVPCQEWALEGLALTGFIWAYLYGAFSTRRRASIFLVVTFGALGGLLVVCLLVPSGGLPFGLPLNAWPIALLLLCGFGLLQWIRHRKQSSLWLGSALLGSSLSAAIGLLDLPGVASLVYLATLPLFAIETYRAVLADLSAYGLELQTISKRALEQTRDLAFVLEIGQAIVASLDLPVVLERVSEAVARAVDADWAYVLLPVDQDPETLVIAARYSWWGRRWTQDSQVQRRVVIHLADFSLLRHAILRRRQVMANDPVDYEQFAPLHNLLARPQSGPTLIQPIYVQDRSLGAVLLGHVGNQRTFSVADATLCQALVAQVATAVDNARLYQSIDGQTRQLSTLLRSREDEVTRRQAILESIAEGVVVAGEAGDVIMANTAAERILGVSRKQLMGQTIKRLYAGLLHAGGRGASDQAVFEWGNKLVRGSFAPVKTPDSGLLGYVAVFRDVTGELQAERAKRKFVATISHELRTPLTSIKGYIELLVAGAVGNLQPGQHRFLDVVQSNTERMVSLVNKLITVSEMDEGAIQIDFRPVDMKGVIEEAVQAIRAEAMECQMDLEMNVPPDLSRVKGDPQRLRQIMDNLLDNALRYTPAGGRISVWAIEAHLRDGGASPQDYLVVNVRDTGVGIPPQDHTRIFEKFYRVDNSLSLRAGGTGMGLAIARSLIEAHGGRIWVESEPESGSTFSFTIPL